MTETLADAPPGAVPLPEGWEGVLAPLETASGDRRMLSAAGYTARPMPQPFGWQIEDWPGHDGSVVIGSIETEEVRTLTGADAAAFNVPDGTQVAWGSGRLDLGCEEGAEFARRLAAGFAGGVSIDLDNTEMEPRNVDGTPLPDLGPDIEEEIEWELPDDVIMYATAWRISSAVGCRVPAFAEAKIRPAQAAALAAPPVAPSGGGGGAASRTDPVLSVVSTGAGGYVTPILGERHTDDLTALAVSGDTGLPIADPATAWDPAGATQRIFEANTDEAGMVDTAAVAKAYLWVDDSADMMTPEAYALGFADIIGGTLTTVPDGVAACATSAAAMQGPSPDELGAINAAICSLYDAIQAGNPDWPDCPVAPAGLTAAAGLDLNRPPAAWFTDPQLTGPTALKVTEDGRVYGHLATWGTCHVGFPGACVTAPESGSGYAYFLVGELDLDDGTTIPVGSLSMDIAHARPRGLSYEAVLEHYSTANIPADVTVGQDSHGIWVAGALRSDVDPGMLRRFKAAALSGDWRRLGGRLELVAALSTPSGGFPIPRIGMDDGRQTALVAAGVLAPHREPEAVGPSGALVAAAATEVERRAHVRNRKERLASRIGRDRASRAAAAAARIR